MKELYRKEQWALAVYDDNNYVIYNHTKPIQNKKTGKVSYKFSYFSQIHQAIRELSRLIANETANDLSEWVKSLQSYYTELETLLSATDSQ